MPTYAISGLCFRVSSVITETIGPSQKISAATYEVSKILRQNSCGSNGPPTSARLAFPSSPDALSLLLERLCTSAPRCLARNPMAFAALAAGAGILFAQFRPPVFLLGVLLLPMLFPWPQGRRSLGWLLLTTLLFAGLHRTASLPRERLSSVLAQARSQSIPVRFSGTVEAELPGGGFRFHLATLTQGSTTLPVDNVIRLQVPSRRILPGDRLTGTGRLSAPPKPRNPGESSPQNAGEARIDAASFHQLQVVGVSLPFRATLFANHCREWIAEAITHGIPPGSDSSALIQAMVLGIRDAASRDLKEVFRRSGAMHLFSVSGLHVAIFASVIWALMRPFRVSRVHTVLIIAGAAFFYAFLTGLSPPAVRAAVMLSVVLFGFALRREPRILNSLGFAAILLLAVDTRQLFDIGFQLSFAVMAAIALLSPPFEQLFRRFTSPDPFIPHSLLAQRQRKWENIANYVGSLVSVSLAAWIGSLPLTLWYFGNVSLISILANCALIPTSFLVMALATFSLGLNILHLPWIPTLVNQLNGLCANLLLALASFFAHLPGAAIELTPISRALSNSSRAEASLIVFDIQQSCAPQAIVLPEQSGRPNPPVWLVDPGDVHGYARTVRPWLQEQRVRELEGLFLTHGDNQHVGAVPACLRDFTVHRTLFGHLGGRSPSWNQSHRQSLQPGQVRLDLNAGNRLELAENITIRVLFPPPDFPDQALADDECLILLLEWDGWRVLSLSDSGFVAEKWLLEHNPGLRCDVVIRSQHRCDSAGFPEFLHRLRSRCVISTNCRFPSSERIGEQARDQIASLGIALFDQEQTGAVTLTPGSDRLVIRPYLGAEPLILYRKSS